NESWMAGVEGGVKWYVKDQTFVQAIIEYDFIFDESDRVEDLFEDAAVIYGLGMGIRFRVTRPGTARRSIAAWPRTPSASCSASRPSGSRTARRSASSSTAVRRACRSRRRTSSRSSAAGARARAR